ncbi:uroporphyrinogen decarboxylase [Helicosporidium sp. ATCC 50920]|nr:uroporphyrinogen decarboxylase [Helicosporidium sp. ATCC 50920]|eukprot:KDD75807.1 uroporphyrinogen decarboxylase [Helicosporidium sp. ATCC 50920]
MRQAGRYMPAYRELCRRHPSFRERSESAELAAEISLQPWRAFRPDGVILFSDILTPLGGMGVDWDVVPGSGPVIARPVRDSSGVRELRPLCPEESMACAGEALRALRREVGSEAAVLGFVGAPFTLASYLVEGGKSARFVHVRRMAYADPETLRALLDRLADAVVAYVRFQADAGAQAVQVFDSWAGVLSPELWDDFVRPGLERIVSEVGASHPSLPLILFAARSGALLERLAATRARALSLCHTLSLADVRERLAQVPELEGGLPAVQGNVDPALLYAQPARIRRAVRDTVAEARELGFSHVLNLGHGIHPDTPEDAVRCFFEEAKSISYAA